MPTIKNIVTIGVASLVLLTIVVNANQTQQLKLVRLDGSEVNSSSSQIGLANVSWEEANKHKNQNAQSSISSITSATTESSSSVVVSSNTTSGDSNNTCIVSDDYTLYTANSKRINYVIQYYISQGMSCTGSVYWTANMLWESKLEPSKTEYGNSIGIGLLQWSFDRRITLSQNCNPIGDLDCQLNFTIKEMTGSNKSCKLKEVLSSEDILAIKESIYCFTRWNKKAKHSRWTFAEKILNNIK